MKALKVVTLSTLLAVTALAVSGCSSAQKGAAGAGLAGGIAGAVVGNNWVPVGPTTGAVIGGTSGAAIGGLVGDAYDQVTQADTERELENLRAQLTEKENELAALNGKAAPSADQLAELDNLRSQLADAQSKLAAAQADAADKANLGGEIAALKTQISDLKNALQQAQDEADALRQQINDKETQVGDLRNKVDVLQTSLNAKDEATDALKKQLADMNVKLEETSRGLQMTIVDSLLYTPGKAELSNEGHDLIAKVAGILKEKFPNRELLVEGHTDNQPIKMSGWRSNWELGAARALTMLHELVEVHGIDPAMVSASSYGEFRPSTTNATAEGRRDNRRAVIVILPEKISTVGRKSLASAN
ncbi:OmpA family protein [Candidatus Sumerlaeota bacterium]|nr:OmpA family protein [Candidatus Sumerlaeota bacterium]